MALNDLDSHLLLNTLGSNATVEHDTKMSTLTEESQYLLFSMLKPKIYQDGNEWCVLYGENIQDGICGFGETPFKAVMAFNRAWDTPINNQPKAPTAYE